MSLWEASSGKSSGDKLLLFVDFYRCSFLTSPLEYLHGITDYLFLHLTESGKVGYVSDCDVLQ